MHYTSQKIHTLFAVCVTVLMLFGMSNKASAATTVAFIFSYPYTTLELNYESDVESGYLEIKGLLPPMRMTKTINGRYLTITESKAYRTSSADTLKEIFAIDKSCKNITLTQANMTEIDVGVSYEPNILRCIIRITE